MNEVNQRRQPRVNKQIIFLVCIYIVLSVSNRFSASNNQSDYALIAKIEDGNTMIPLQTILNQIDKQKFQGEWRQVTKSSTHKLTKQNGKFEMGLIRHTESDGQKFTLNINIKNGQYIDDGEFTFHIPQLQVNHWATEHIENKLTAKALINQSSIKVNYNQQLIFRTMGKGQFNLTNMQIIFMINNKTLTKLIKIQTQNQQIQFILRRASYNVSGTILFALILFLISYSEFSACLQIIKKFIQGEQSPANYSFLTMVIAMMWDSGLCLTAFIQAFQNQQNIVLFIVPAFILCLLFTNLQLRIMVIVFQAMSGQNDIRQVICRFNLVSYGGIIAMYPLMVLTNMGTSLFLFFSLIFLPQIYTNAITGKRPNPNSIYYNQFLLFRFLLILYLKCFPYNIFGLRPNYLLGFGCLFLVACQFGLLWIQKIYGPKKVLPKFLLPSVYNYGYDLNVEQIPIQQCTICLEVLNKQPQGSIQPVQIQHKIMKTPCGHKYHSCCLVQWMRLKMECPQCRTKLPAYQ